MFPKAKTSRLDSDAAPDTKTQKTIIENFIGKKYDILIATQIVFSWLQDFKNNQPNIAIISADTLLHLPDFRSGERTYQLIKTFENILGPNSELIIQTYNPETSVIKCAADGDWTPFFQEEIETRQALDYPPFSQLVKLTLRHKNPQKSGQEAKILVAKLKLINKNTEIEISDALPAFIPKEKGNYVWNIIIKFKISQPEIKISSEFLHRRNSLLQYVPSNWEIDVDPDDLL